VLVVKLLESHQDVLSAHQMYPIHANLSIFWGFKQIASGLATKNPVAMRRGHALATSGNVCRAATASHTHFLSLIKKPPAGRMGGFGFALWFWN
jgi:predicted nucleotide-binding protein (sugar kinase/HSP70/actin superfamily)